MKKLMVILAILIVGFVGFVGHCVSGVISPSSPSSDTIELRGECTIAVYGTGNYFVILDSFWFKDVYVWSSGLGDTCEEAMDDAVKETKMKMRKILKTKKLKNKEMKRTINVHGEETVK